MYLEEVYSIMGETGSREEATQAMFKLMRQGLTNGAAIPEVETEAEQAAHHMLGCDNYLAIINMYATADTLREDEPTAAAIISSVTDEHLMTLTKAVIGAHGPIGVHNCEQQRRQ